MANETRVFNPTVLQTKQDLLIALRAGQLRTSHYNALTENQKLYVELVCFGDYTGEAAVKVIDPTIYNPKMVANRMMADPNVRQCIDELTVAKDSKFKSEAVAARDAALAKLSYIMKTSKNEEVQLAAAKTILEKTNDYMKAAAKKEQEDGVTKVEYRIQVDQVNVNTANQTVRRSQDAIIIPDDEAQSEPTVNPDTGLPYVLMYEGVNNYDKEVDVDDNERDGGEDASSEFNDEAGSANSSGDAIEHAAGNADSRAEESREDDTEHDDV